MAPRPRALERSPRSIGAALTLACLTCLPLGCDAAGDITPGDLADVFIRRSVCRGEPLTAPLVRIVAGADGSPAAASPELACGRGAEDCAAFLACSGVDVDTTCDPAMVTPSCDGDVLASCDATGHLRRVDCANDPNGNVTCLVDEGGVARCAVEPCVGDGELTCVEDRIEFCGNGVRHRSDDCALEGRTCVSNGMRAACVDRAAACERAECDGDVHYRCVSSGLGSIGTDCAARIGGGRCAVVGAEARCVIDAMECEDGAAECAGAVLRMCIDGRWIELDCARFANATCREDPSGEAPPFSCVVMD